MICIARIKRRSWNLTGKMSALNLFIALYFILQNVFLWQTPTANIKPLGKYKAAGDNYKVLKKENNNLRKRSVIIIMNERLNYRFLRSAIKKLVEMGLLIYGGKRIQNKRFRTKDEKAITLRPWSFCLRRSTKQGSDVDITGQRTYIYAPQRQR